MLAWLRLRGAVPVWRAVFFWCGIVSVWLATASPLAMLDEEMLTAHMLQHLLLMTLGAPLILLGFPALRLRANPVFCWFAAVVVLTGWHIPALFALGLSSHLWHHLEHATFFAAGLLFWLPVLPSLPGGSHPRWSMVIYLFLATLPCDALSAFLAFCGHVVYPHYGNVARHFALPALQDQECAGALMWTWVTFAYLIPAVLVTLRLLSPPGDSAMRDRDRDDRLSTAIISDR